jgi:hypothetical protein
MPFKISIHDNISINDLLTVNRKGGVVLKTPHVGNIYPNNLAIASLGIPMLFYDRTLGSKDFNFHPNKIIFGGKSEIIAEPDILTTHSIITQTPENIDSSFKPIIGSKLVDFHMSVLKKALPMVNGFTYTEYIQSNKSMVVKILEEVTKLHPHLWTRIVDENGMTSKATAISWDDIVRLGVYGVTNNKSGWIIPNPVSILFHGTIDISKAKVEDAYLLSGPDMYRYIDGYQEELNEIYDHLKKVLNWELPETMNCHIIPVINMRFIVEIDYKNTLDKLVAAYLKFVSLENLIRSSIENAVNGSSIEKNIKEKEAVKKEIMSCISEGLPFFRQTVFYDIEEENCFTQYDLIKSNGLYIHPWAISSKLCDVSKAFNFLKKSYALTIDKAQEEI